MEGAEKCTGGAEKSTVGGAKEKHKGLGEKPTIFGTDRHKEVNVEVVST